MITIGVVAFIIGVLFGALLYGIAEGTFED